MLEEYPNKRDAKILGEGFSHGFKLGYEGLRVGREAKNLRLVDQLYDKTAEKIRKEVSLGRIAGLLRSRHLKTLLCPLLGCALNNNQGNIG